MLNIYEQFKKIEKNEKENKAFNVISIPSTGHKLGISSEGYPKFFVSTKKSLESPGNIFLELLCVEYNQHCTVIEDCKNVQSGFFSIITLRSNEDTLQVYFIEIFKLALLKLSQAPTTKELSIEVEKIITIFSALNKTPKKDIQGVWAELLVIEKSLNPEIMVSAWHDQNEAKYDFTMGRDKIEVKSTSGEIRKHRFSLDQLNPSQNSQLLIASVIVRESAQCNNGLSIKDLYERILFRLKTIDSQLKLYSTLVAAIGDNYKKWNALFFDYVSAVDTLSFYKVEDVPRINKSDVPPLVSEVVFSSDLSAIEEKKISSANFDYMDSILYRSLF